MLSEYFSPLTLPHLLLAIWLLIFFDCIGSFFNRHLVKSDSTYRPIYWLFGLGLYIFVWYLLHFRYGFKPEIIIVSTIIPFIFLFPNYYRRREYQSLLNFFQTNPLLIVILLLLAPALWVKSSLPPYTTDEVRYHFMSAYQITHQHTWPLGSNSELYTYVPKLIDTLFNLLFSVTKTHSPGRLIHFWVFFSSICGSYSILKKHFSIRVASLFALIGIFLMPDLLIIGTSGYTNYSLAAVLLLAVFSLFDFLHSRNTTALTVAFITFGLASGIKYTALMTMLVFAVLTVVFLAQHSRSRLKLVFRPKIIFILGLNFIIFGGYWYFGNWYFSGNPIYPFLFPCKLQECISTAEFFSGWTLEVNWTNLGNILRQLTAKPYFFVPFIGSLFLPLASRGKDKDFSLFVLIGGSLELWLLGFYSGFHLHYYMYLKLLAISLIAVSSYLRPAYFRVLTVLTLLLVISSLFNHYNIWRYLSPQEVAYARQKTNIYDWIHDRHPFNQDIIRFCADRGPQTLYILDQAIWHTPTNEQFMHIFNVNCTYAGVESISSVEAVKGKLIWLASSQPCQEKLLDSDQDTLVNNLVCLAQPEGKNLYKLDLR